MNPRTQRNGTEEKHKVTIPFAENHLKRIIAGSNLHSSFFQSIGYYNYNHFEIELWVDGSPDRYTSGPEPLIALDTAAVEQVFVQFTALFNMARDMALDFIDFSRFRLVPSDSQDYSIEFPLRLTGNGTATGEHLLKGMLQNFQKNSRFKGLNEANHMEIFSRLKGAYTFNREDAYVYRCDELATSLLNAYPMAVTDEPGNGSNIKIRIRTADSIREKIVKRNLYQNYVSENILFIDVDHRSGGGSLPLCIAHLAAEESGDPPCEADDPVGVINHLDIFLKKSSFKSVVLLLNKLKTKEEAEFLNYLMHSSGITNILLIVFDTRDTRDTRDTLPGGTSLEGIMEFDLELKESPVNLLENYLQFDKPGPKTALDEREEIKISDSLHLSLEYFIKTGETKDMETFRSLMAMLVREKDTAFAETVITANMEKDPVFMALKLAHIYRLKKDHPKMFRLLQEIKGKIPASPPGWLEEFFYLTYIYYEKISDNARADRYFRKLKEPLFIHLANIKLSDRHIYGGDYGKAARILEDAAAYLAQNRYLKDEIDARCQQAKLLRQQQHYPESEKSYKNLFIKSETHNFPLLSAYISSDLGNLFYHNRDNFVQAEVWYKKALKLFQRLENRNGIMLARSNLAEVNKHKGNWRRAEDYLRTVLAYDRERKSDDSAAIDYFNIAHLEYLRHNEAGAREHLEEAAVIFKKKKNTGGIIECELLKLKLALLFPAGNKNGEIGTGVSALKKYREYLKRDQEILRSIFKHIFKQLDGEITEKIDRVESEPLQFEIISLLLLNGGLRAHKLSERLKSLSMRLSGKNRNYYFYHYYYVYFNRRLTGSKGLDPAPAGEEEAFIDMYYFFSRNKRRFSPVLMAYKTRLDEQESIYDVFKSARLVEDYARWKVPGDFFNSLVTELKKIVPADLVRLVIYEKDKKDPVFDFSTGNKFKELTREIMAGALHSLENLNLSAGEIKRSFKSSEKAFYYYAATSVLLWKMSGTLMGVLLLGFLKEEYRDYRLQERGGGLLEKFGSLFHHYYENDFKLNEKLQWIIGESPAMKRLKKQIVTVAAVDFPLLIRGESGSGKDLVARGVHLLSKRASKPFIPVNAAAIPDNLLEAELFGYKKGAFTGASENKTGLIEAAQGGTLFLDEIADLPLNLQAKLLRVLQENEIRRLGETRTIKVDFRLISATNKDLEQLIADGEFR
ncbi:MAG: AAA domain-containing protein, partial [bacterium]|nr:AAA domain-containing protein [bacterium]